MNVGDNDLYFETETSDVVEGDLQLLQVEGVERISRCYELELTLRCHLDGGLGPDLVRELLDRPCRIGFGAGALPTSGVLSELEMLDLPPDGPSLYRAVMVPRLWYLTLTKRSRVFQEISIPGIVDAVLTEHGLRADEHFEIRCQADYPEREYVVQYEESDFAFLSRLMEHEGIFYFFEQNPDGERLIVTDTNRELVAVPEHEEIPYSGAAGLADGTGSITNLRRIDRVRPARVLLREYNWRTPNLLLNSLADIDPEKGRGLQYTYGEHFKDDAEGSRLAQVRAEEWQTGQQTYTATTTIADVRPGHRFTLHGAPVGELDLEYLVTSVRHNASADDTQATGAYGSQLELIPTSVQYRPPRITPKPRIDGIMHAKIDGAVASTAAPIDDQGRYKVVLPYDLGGKAGGKASRWVRMAQASAGAGYGTHFPLHIGTEVMIAHVGGDPDRPVIVGAVPNPTKASFIHSGRATRSAIRTRSGIIIDFEDDA